MLWADLNGFEEFDLKEVKMLMVDKSNGCTVELRSMERGVRLSVEEDTFQLLEKAGEFIEQWIKTNVNKNFRKNRKLSLIGTATRGRSGSMSLLSSFSLRKSNMHSPPKLHKSKSGDLDRSSKGKIDINTMFQNPQESSANESASKRLFVSSETMPEFNSGRRSRSATLTPSFSVASTNEKPGNSKIDEMKTSFLLYQRLLLMSQLAKEKDMGVIERELGRVRELEETLTDMRIALSEKESKLNELNKEYFASGKDLALEFKSLVKIINNMTKGVLASTFSTLHSEYCKMLGNANGESESDDDDDGIVDSRGRSGSTAGWAESSPAVQRTSSVAIGFNWTEEEVSDMSNRFRQVLDTLEAILSLSRPVDFLFDSIKMRSKQLASEVEDLKGNLESTVDSMERENESVQKVTGALESAQTFLKAMEKRSDHLDGLAQCIRKHDEKDPDCALWISFLEDVKSANLISHQTYHALLTQEYKIPSDAVEIGQGGSLASCRSDVLFELLVTGEGDNKADNFLKVFLYGYVSWTSHMSLLERLVEVFCTVPDKNKPGEARSIHEARSRVIWMLRSMLQTYNINEDEKFVELTRSFLNTVAIVGYAEARKELEAMLDVPFNAGKNIDTQDFFPLKMSENVFFSMDPMEIAKKMTKDDELLYDNLSAMDLYEFSWTSQNHPDGITSFIRRFNITVVWFLGVIKKQPTVANLSMLLKLAESFMQIKNYNGLMMVITALSKATLKFPPELKKSLDNFYDLKNKNFSKLREMHAKAMPPFIPYVGMYLTDLSVVGQRKTHIKSFINFEKLVLQANIYDNILGKRK